ncbi:PLP-dependent aspartate aminotransferase family protein [Variovorax sp. J31P207]|uniref:trans-sulfuration enzyme family protein n=1 Tax=Variovorax sp. J31P207 TaxID=3053510 RepID=UPI0025751625|nr:PLP-dependent aspartate aminotransferase family protein [Variovorax sp. J31P207]MDM0071626.1 PLP-dependent aspartate aminotransferase family protein [Variovorax sp. J31P207]
MLTHTRPIPGNLASCGIRTLAVHAGQHPDPGSGAIATPVVSTSSFAFDDFDAGAARFAGAEPGYLYSRFANPTVAVFERKMAALEGGDQAIAFSSGMAAICATLLAVLKAGDEVVYVGTLYGGTDGVMRQMLPRLGIRAVHASAVEDIPGCVNERTRAVYVETPSNPTLGICDLAKVAALTKPRGLISIADNTFATPVLTRPIGLGIDVVVHSATKYIGGHGDATGGVAVAGLSHANAIRKTGMKELGGCMSPHDAALFIRGLKTLPLRMAASCDNAQMIAEALRRHPAVAKVHYPGLPEHPGHDIAVRQMRRFGGILSLELAGGQPAARVFLDKLKLVTQAVSVGDTDSLACHPASTTHSAVDPAARLAGGVTPGLVRMSLGIEDGDDLQRDVIAALEDAS